MLSHLPRKVAQYYESNDLLQRALILYRCVPRVDGTNLQTGRDPVDSAAHVALDFMHRLHRVQTTPGT